MNCPECGRGENGRVTPVPGVEEISFACGSVLVQPGEHTGLEPVWHQGKDCRGGDPADLRAEVNDLKNQVAALAAKAAEQGWFGAKESK